MHGRSSNRRVISRGGEWVKRAPLALALWYILVAVCHASELPEPHGFVNDFTGRVDQESLESLRARTAELKTQKDLEIGLAVIASTGGTPIEQYANQLARKWGVGSKESNRGVLVVVALDDRTSRIEISRHFEGVLTDGKAGSILRAARPEFRDGRYGAGLIKIVDAIAAVADEPAPRASASKESASTGDAFTIIFGLVVFLVIWAAVMLPVVGVIILLVWAITRLLKARKSSWHRPSTPGTSTHATSGSDYSSRDYDSGSSSDTSSTSSSASSSSSDDSSTSSDSSGGSDSGSSFGGSSDYGGGGASDSW